MNFTVRIEQFDRMIDVGADETILECALFEGIDYPFACQQGQCGSCKSQLVAGEVFMPSGYNPMALTEAERARGMILACQAQPRTNCVVSVIAIDGRIVHPVRELACTMIESIAAGRFARIVKLRIDAGGPFNFEAGQHVLVGLPDGREQPVGLANRPSDPTIELHLDPAASELAVGTTVAVRGPYGTAYLHDEHVGPMLLVAMHTGLAPLLSIIGAALEIGMSQRIHLYVADGYDLERLEALAARHANLRLVTVGAAELITTIARDFADLAAYRVYVAAPMRESLALEALVIERGMLPEHWADHRADVRGYAP